MTRPLSTEMCDHSQVLYLLDMRPATQANSAFDPHYLQSEISSTLCAL